MDDQSIEHSKYYSDMFEVIPWIHGVREFSFTKGGERKAFVMLTWEKETKIEWKMSSSSGKNAIT